MLKPWNNFSVWWSLPLLWIATTGSYRAGACVEAQALPPVPGTVCGLGEQIIWQNANPLFSPVSLIEAVVLKKERFILDKTMLAVRALLRNTGAVGWSVWESLKYRQGLTCRVFSAPWACLAGYIRNSLKACCKHGNSTNQHGAQEEHCFCNKSPYRLSACHKGFLWTRTWGQNKSTLVISWCFPAAAQ